MIFSDTVCLVLYLGDWKVSDSAKRRERYLFLVTTLQRIYIHDVTHRQISIMFDGMIEDLYTLQDAIMNKYERMV